MIPRNAGQTCVHAKRFFVQKGNHDVLIARLTQRKKNRAWAMSAHTGLVSTEVDPFGPSHQPSNEFSTSRIYWLIA
ncbi:MAG: hypothetical protein FalmKO_08340 [Falsiruegeria mediterranea]